MRAAIIATGLALSVVAATAASAQQPTGQPRPTTTTSTTQGQFRGTTSLTPNRDVILEIPELSVDSIGLTVSDVRAHVALDANAMNLVQLTAGVDVGIKKVQLGIVGVLAEAYLYIDLDNVGRIVNRVVQTLDRNPQILIQVLKTVDTGVNALTGQNANQSGQAPPR
jgi:transcriptional accessory protein Tex/SPT6